MKVYCVENRIYCGVCNKTVITNNFPNHLKSQSHVNILLKNHCTN